MTDYQAKLRSDMEGSLNWPTPGATIVSSIPIQRRKWRRVWNWLRIIFRLA